MGTYLPDLCIPAQPSISVGLSAYNQCMAHPPRDRFPNAYVGDLVPNGKGWTAPA